MTMRLDLIKRHDLMRPMQNRTIIRRDCYGCADCGRWFQFARQLVEHVAEGCDD